MPTVSELLDSLFTSVEELLELVADERLALEQRQCHPVERQAVLRQEAHRLVVGLVG